MFAKRLSDQTEGAIAEALGIKLQMLFPEVTALAEGKVEGLTCNGISVKTLADGTYLAIVRVSLANTSRYPELWDGYGDGDYVAYGGGPTLWQAVAKVEAELAAGRCKLVPDRYSANRGERDAAGGSRKRKKPPVVR